MTDANLTLYILFAAGLAVALPWVMPNLFGLRGLAKRRESEATA